MMPSPKDPVKRVEWIRKLTEKRYPNRKSPPPKTEETRQKLSLANRGKVISSAHREALRQARLRDRAKGRSLFGGLRGRKKARRTTRIQRKGKTYKEIYGLDLGRVEADKRRWSNSLR